MVSREGEGEGHSLRMAPSSCSRFCSFYLDDLAGMYIYILCIAIAIILDIFVLYICTE